MKPIRLIRGFLTVGVWTLASRVLGFVREILLLGLIGPGPVMDAFVAAFRLPNMFRRFFAEGAFNAAFVPMFSRKFQAGEDAHRFARDALNALAFAVLVLTGLGMVFMPALVWATAHGFAGDERFDLTVDLGRIAFPYIFFMALAALFSGILNATGRFAVAAAAPVLLNICVITAMLVAWMTGGMVITWLIWAIPVAGVAQLALTWSAAGQAGFALRPGLPRFSPDVRKMLVVAVPAALSSGVMQINLVVGQLVASPFEGAISWLFAADRLYQLPLGVVGIAVGVVLLPALSRRLEEGDEAGAKDAFNRAAEMSLALALPAAVALFVVPLPLVQVLFERGAMTPADSQAIAWAVAIYALGLPSFVMQKFLQPLFFARSDTVRPFRYAMIAMVINAIVAVGLIPVAGWVSPAIATSVAGWAMVWLLWRGARDLGPTAHFDDRFRRRILRLTVSAAIMGGVLFLVAMALSTALQAGWLRYAALAVLVGAGLLSYGLACHMTGGLRLSELRGAMRRG